MAAKNAQAMERLLTKLSAVRKTLRGDERNLLDAMVLASQPEVAVHSQSLRPIANKASRPTPRTASDVEMHTAAVRRISVEAKNSSASSRPEAAKASEPEGRIWMGISIEDGNYRVNTL